MPHDLFPARIETDRLVFERVAHDTVDPFELYDFVSQAGWQEAATEHMPWLRFQRLDQVVEFIEKAEEQWAEGETARYLLRAKSEGGALVGTTGFGPEWDERLAGSGVVLAPTYWGNGYGTERASTFVELTFETYDLEAYHATCAAENERSRRMIERYVDRYGGRHEGCFRQHSARPCGEVTDQHRFTILREEYETATADRETMEMEIRWGQ
ncbi:MAG: GNAT family N-acetyltransferase [Halanaeroarchaeum sp.]